MKSLDQFFQSDLVHALGWTIVHSLWQGLLIVFLLTVGLVLLRRHSSRLRYLAGYLALLALTLCSVGTFFRSLPERPAGASASAGQTYSADEIMDISTVSMSEIIAPIAAEGSYWQLFIRFIEGNLPFITMVWMFGVLALSLRFLAELAYIQRLKYQPGQLSPGVYQGHLNELSKRMGIDKFIELKENIRINSPMVIGFIKPVILVPFGLLSRLDTEQVESILAHELAHIKRHDYVFNLFQSLVEILLFFNPATWWISSFIRSEREHCCDEMAIAQTGNHLVFVQTLAKLEEHRALPSDMVLAFNGRRDSGVLGRVRRIVNSEEPFSIPYKLFWSCAILLCALGLFAFQDRAVLSQTPAASADESSVVSPAVSAEPVLLTETTQISELEKADPSGRETSRPEPADDRKATAAVAGAVRLNGLDTVPESLKKLRQELIQLEKTFQEQEMALQKQSREIQMKMLKLEQEIQQMENEQLKKVYELEKSSQEIELNRNMQLQELEIGQNTLGSEELELRVKMQQLEMKMQEEGMTEVLQKQQSELHRELIELEKKRREFELAKKRNDLNVEKDMQLLNNKRWQLQQEAKINQNNKRLEIMGLEQQLQELQFKNQMMQNEKQNKMQLLQMQMQEEAQKLGKRNDRE